MIKHVRYTPGFAFLPLSGIKTYSRIEIMPQIRGVLVVCPNGNNTVIKEMVKGAVVTVLDISSKKVCVTGGLN